MYSPFNKNNRFVFNKKTTLSLTALIIVVVLGVAACQTTSDSGENFLRPPGPFRAYIYGKIDSIAVNDTNHVALLIIKNKDKCTDSLHVGCIKSVKWIDKSGGYSLPLYSYGDLHGYPVPDSLKGDSSGFDTSFNVALTSYKSLDGLVTKTVSQTNIDFDAMIKRYDGFLLKPKEFNINFHLHAPYDSVRVDFTLPDSSKFSR
jgi:hypothetical protein